METSVTKSAGHHDFRYVATARWRRFLYFTLVSCTSLAGVLFMLEIITANGITLAEIGIFLLFAITFSLVAASFWTAIIGFIIHLCCHQPLQFAAPLRQSDGRLLSLRTAVIMPIYNEQPERVIAGLEANYRSLQKTGEIDNFQFFLLSDSTDNDIAEREQQLWQSLCQRLGAKHTIHYRRRPHNKDRKVGNIVDFCVNWGRHFDAMIVLDADSIMSGTTMLKLARLMQANPKTGIIQTVPLAVNQETLFARIMQFGTRLCSELLCTGKSFWQLGEANYYGHNAIIRIQPFIEHCQLPYLPGRGPLAGAILSHDFVEAAFMRRAGWQVWNLPDGTGSYEEMPSNILDYAKRDRRWCQGNLQHLRLLFTPGLHIISRLHLLMGALAYISSPLWLCLLVLGLLQLVMQALATISYFAPGDNLFPTWPVFKTAEAMLLFTLTVAMLITPKLLAMVLALTKPKRREAFGGTLALICGTGLEIVFTALIAPIMMVFHTLFIILTLGGWAVTWNPQVRGNRGLGIIEALQHHILQLLLGISVGLLVLQFVPEHLWWLSPVLAGLLLSVPLAVISSRVITGQWLLRWRLLTTPEELQAPWELLVVKARTH